MYGGISNWISDSTEIIENLSEKTEDDFLSVYLQERKEMESEIEDLNRQSLEEIWEKMEKCETQKEKTTKMLDDLGNSLKEGNLENEKARISKASLEADLEAAKRMMENLISQSFKKAEEERAVSDVGLKTSKAIRSMNYAVTYVYWKMKKCDSLSSAHGYVINPKNNRISNFNFDMNDTSPEVAREWLWDHISAGVSSGWNRFIQ